ncbi:glycoside hydrolase family 97 catalytic domain-containing protein [Haliangium sp.]|uniref:glycoside hydrolase family 97 catalytic domain-containing protein n=1 Tax=Haliangium sp. TaxID=2663208 RepID=UPI003D0A0F52
MTYRLEQRPLPLRGPVLISTLLSVTVLGGCGDNSSPGTPIGPDARPLPAQEQTVTSPDGQISVRFVIDDGHPRYAVSRADTGVIADSALGLVFQDAAPLGEDMALVEVERRSEDNTWAPVWGEAAEIRDHYQEMTVRLAENGADGRRLDIVFRVFDDGVGLRYQVPAQAGLDQVAVIDELTEFRFAQGGTAWWTNADFEGDEFLYSEDTLETVVDANTPMTVKLADGVHVSVHEADLDDYAAMTLAAVDGAPRAFRSALVPAHSGTGNEAVKAELSVPFETPWRTLTIGANAGALMESHLILNLNDPCAICDGDTSWIVPSKYVGVWWEIHKGLATWAPGPTVAATTDNTKRYIDFAAEHGIPYVLAEGWNLGWEGDWGDMDFTTSQPDFDLDEVVSYGASKGVAFMAHMETGSNVEGLEAQIDDAFALYESKGISAIKTGYVGTIPGYHHYSQRMVRHYTEVAAKAAAHGIMVNAHEPIKPTGERRTYPNFMSREGVRGMEWNAWSDGNPPSHTLIIPFTRMLGGPVDYNAGIFNPLWAPEKIPENPFYGAAPTRVHTTRARQLALYVILLSGVQMVTDVPENYAGQAEISFIEQVPVTWDETRVLQAEIGRYITVARRRGDEWYLGSGTDDSARTLEIPLDFLGEGTYVAETYTDAGAADFIAAPELVARQDFRVTAADTLVASMEAGGGQAVRIRPATAQDMNDLPEYRPPSLTIDQVEVPSQAVIDDFVLITTQITNTGNLVGAERIELSVDGEVVSSRLVRVDADATDTVAFELHPTTLGSISVSVDGGAPTTVAVVARDQAPVAPTNLRVTEVRANAVALAWDSAPGAVGYRVYRHRPGGIYGPEAVAEVDAATTSYLDDAGLRQGDTVFYIVRAVHAGEALSPASNEVEETTRAREVAVTFRVRAPVGTPAGDMLFVPGSIDALGPWDPGHLSMTSAGGEVWEVTVAIPEGAAVQYKYTRGSWETVEWWGGITGITNRSISVDGGAATMVVDNTSTAFDDNAVPDIEKGIRFWRDPLVVSTVPAEGASVASPASIEIAFARDVTAPESGYAGTVQVSGSAGTITGEVTEPSPGTLVFTPTQALTNGAYTVTVSGVMSALGTDSVPMQSPYELSFTVQ